MKRTILMLLICVPVLLLAQSTTAGGQATTGQGNTAQSNMGGAQNMGTQGMQGGVMRPEQQQFAALPGLPDCVTGAVVHGDPMASASVIHLRTASGCTVPMHWHTANEQLMIIGGNGTMSMRGTGAQTLTAGSYVYLPSKHPHSVTCASGCELYLSADGPIDIHYIDANGQEISIQQALGKMK